MAITVKHTKVSTIPDGDDSSLIRPSDWNDDHVLTGTIPVANGGTGASTLTGYVKGNGTAAMTASATVPSTDVTGLGTMSTQNANAVAITGGTMSGVTVTGYIPTSEKAQPLGVATLDAGGKVPTSQIPMQGDLNYQGTWNASTNTPTLTSSVGTKGYYYVVDVAGSTNLNGITDWNIGDWAIFNGSVWQKVDNTDAVTSVNGQVGTVVLTTTNINEGTNLYYTDVRARASNSAGTGISYDSATGVITNSAPDQIVSITGAGTSVVTGTYPNFTVTSTDSTLGTVTSVAATAGTGISVTGSPITTSGTLNITNTAPDQTVVLTAGTGISTSGTYPNFTITNTSPSLGGDVVGPSSATDNAVARFDTTTGKLIQNSLVIIGDTGSVTGVNALTAESLTVNNDSTLGFSNADTLDVRARIISDLEPNTNNAKDIGTNGRNWRDGFFGRTLHTVNLELTGTASFDGSQGTAGQVLTSAGTGATPTWTTPTTGTVTSVSGTAPIASSGGNTPAISISQATTSTDGYLSSTDWNTFNGKQPAGTYVNSVSATSPITSTGGTTPTIAMPAATGSVNGYLTSTDWTTFNSKGSGTVTSVGGTGTVSGISLSGTVTSSGNLTLGGTLDLSSPPAIGNTAPNTVAGTVIQATNGIVVNSNTVSASYTIPSGSSAMSAGPMTVASGQTVTVSSGSRWVVL